MIDYLHAYTELRAQATQLSTENVLRFCQRKKEQGHLALALTVGVVMLYIALAIKGEDRYSDATRAWCCGRKMSSTQRWSQVTLKIRQSMWDQASMRHGSDNFQRGPTGV